MNVLVAVGSKYGSTNEIGHAIAEAIAERGATVTLRPVEDVAAVDEFDAVVIGSAVYAGHWLRTARELVYGHAVDLSRKPVWLFSSGPVGDPPKPKEEAADIAALVATTHAIEHRTFPGRLRRSLLTFTDRAIVTALRVPDDDSRDFDEIRAWGRSISDALAAKGVA